MTELAINKPFTLWGGPYPKKMPWINRTFYIHNTEVWLSNTFKNTPDIYLLELLLGCLFGFNTREYDALFPIFKSNKQLMDLVRENMRPHFIDLVEIYANIAGAGGVHEKYVIKAGSPYCTTDHIVHTNESILMAFRAGKNVSYEGLKNSKLIRLAIYKDICSVNSIDVKRLKMALSFEKLICHPNIPRFKNGEINYEALFSMVPRLVIIVPPHICGENLTISILVKNGVRSHYLISYVPPTHSMSDFYEKFVNMGGNAEFVPPGMLSEETYVRLYNDGKIRMNKIPPRYITQKMAEMFVENKGNPVELPMNLQTQQLYDKYLTERNIKRGAARYIPSRFANTRICREYLIKHGINAETIGLGLGKFITRDVVEECIKRRETYEISLYFIPKGVMDKKLYELYVDFVIDKLNAETTKNNVRYHFKCDDCPCTENSSTHHGIFDNVPLEFITHEMCKRAGENKRVCLKDIPRELRDSNMCLYFAGTCKMFSNIPEKVATDDLFLSYRIFSCVEPITEELNEKIYRELPLLRPHTRKRFLSMYRLYD